MPDPDQFSDVDGVGRHGAAVAQHLYAAGLQLHRARDVLGRELWRASQDIDDQVDTAIQTLDVAIQATQQVMLSLLSRAERPLPGRGQAWVEDKEATA